MQGLDLLVGWSFRPRSSQCIFDADAVDAREDKNETAGAIS
jgi:hypothetical protein